MPAASDSQDRFLSTVRRLLDDHYGQDEFGPLADALAHELSKYTARDEAAHLADSVLRRLRSARALEQWKVEGRDPLTCVWHRRVVRDLFAGALDLSRRIQRPLCVALLDVDNLKYINDYHGLPSGDAALVSVAGWLESVLHGSDLVARYGGDEFLVVLHDGVEQAAERLERARLLIEQSPVGKGLSGTQQEQFERCHEYFESAALAGLKLTVKIGLTQIAADDNLETALSRIEGVIRKGANRLRAWGQNRFSSCPSPCRSSAKCGLVSFDLTL